jgi:hypothetical protein
MRLGKLAKLQDVRRQIYYLCAAKNENPGGTMFSFHTAMHEKTEQKATTVIQIKCYKKIYYNSRR